MLTSNMSGFLLSHRIDLAARKSWCESTIRTLTAQVRTHTKTAINGARLSSRISHCQAYPPNGNGTSEKARQRSLEAIIFGFMPAVRMTLPLRMGRNSRSFSILPLL